MFILGLVVGILLTLIVITIISYKYDPLNDEEECPNCGCGGSCKDWPNH